MNRSGTDPYWDPRYRRIHELLDTDPEAAWPHVVRYVEEHPATLESQDLIEDAVHLHGERLIKRIEEQALRSAAFAETVLTAHVGGAWGPEIDRFHALQQRLSPPGWTG